MVGAQEWLEDVNDWSTEMFGGKEWLDDGNGLEINGLEDTWLEVMGCRTEELEDERLE